MTVSIYNFQFSAIYLHLTYYTTKFYIYFAPNTEIGVSLKIDIFAFLEFLKRWIFQVIFVLKRRMNLITILNKKV